MQIKLIIPGEPVAKQRPKHGKGFTYTPEKTVNYEIFVKQLYISNCKVFLEGQLKIIVKAYFTIPKSTSKKNKALMLSKDIRPTKKPDCDNILKIICDALNGIAYHDDSQIVIAQAYKYYDDQPRVEVKILEMTGVEE